MAIHLAENNYGKQRVRILRVSRTGSQHEIQELTIGIRLEGRAKFKTEAQMQ